MKFWIFTPPLACEKPGGFLVANFFHIFPRKYGLKFVTPETSENFTTFFTAKKEIYHLELALGATSRNFSSLISASSHPLPKTLLQRFACSGKAHLST